MHRREGVPKIQVLSSQGIVDLLKDTSVHSNTRLARSFYTKAETMHLIPCFIMIVHLYAIGN